MRRGIYNEQPYRGRYKGSTDQRIPNDTFREGAERIGLGGYSVTCKRCGKVYKGTKGEVFIWECDCNLGED